MYSGSVRLLTFPIRSRSLHEVANELIVSPGAVIGMQFDRTPDFLDPGDVFGQCQVVDLPNPLYTYGNTPLDDAFRERVVSNLFVLGEATVLPYGRLCVFEREVTKRIREIRSE